MWRRAGTTNEKPIIKRPAVRLMKWASEGGAKAERATREVKRTYCHLTSLTQLGRDEDSAIG